MAHKQAVVCDMCGAVKLFDDADNRRDDIAPAGWFDVYRANDDDAWDIASEVICCSITCVLVHMARLEAADCEESISDG